MSANLENSAVATGLEKVCFHSNPKEGQCPKCSNYQTIALSSLASKVMLKIFQARLQHYMNRELQDVQAGCRKGTRDQMANIRWLIKQGGSRKTSTSASLTTQKPLTVWITINCGKFLREGKTRLSSEKGILSHLPPKKSVCRSRSNS